MRFGAQLEGHPLDLDILAPNGLLKRKLRKVAERSDVIGIDLYFHAHGPILLNHFMRSGVLRGRSPLFILPGKAVDHGPAGKPGIFFEPMSKRRRGFPSETKVKRGVRFVHGEKELAEKLGRNDLCPCWSGKRFKNCCLKSGCF